MEPDEGALAEVYIEVGVYVEVTVAHCCGHEEVCTVGVHHVEAATEILAQLECDPCGAASQRRRTRLWPAEPRGIATPRRPEPQPWARDDEYPPAEGDGPYA